MRKKLAILAMTAAAFLSLAACGGRTYYVTPAPAPGAYWVPGHYTTGPYGGQQWVPGHWR
jgi:hypothetical protein